MTIEKKDSYILISSNENSFTAFYNSFLEREKEFKENHVVLNISNKININKEDFLLFLDIIEQKNKGNTSFVIINKMVNIDDFPENLNIVPTLIEAEDILEMESIERELGF